MAEQENDDKTEEASEKKIGEAVEKGRTPQSRETSVFLLLTTALVVVMTILSGIVDKTRLYLAALMGNAHQISLGSGADAAALARETASSVSLFVIPGIALLIFASIGAIATTMAPFPIVDRIKPDIGKISPIAGWKRIFSKKGFIEFLKATAKLLLGLLLVGLVAMQAGARLIELPYGGSNALPQVIINTTGRMLAAVCALMAVIATADFFWSRHQWRQDLKMSKQEVKDELKQTMGDPMVRAQRRSIARERARNRMMQAVPTATVVIVNPTHYSVALAYEQGKDVSPRVVAKGRDLIALKIREIAAASNVAIVENVEVAQGLYRSVEINQFIPAAFYEAIAEIIVLVRNRAAVAKVM